MTINIDLSLQNLKIETTESAPNIYITFENEYIEITLRLLKFQARQLKEKLEYY